MKHALYMCLLIWQYINKVFFYQENYQERLTQLTKIDADSGDMQKVDGETRIRLWADVAGGISRGRCYGTGALSANIRPGVPHLTQESCPPENEMIEMFRQEAATVRANAAAANQRVVEADQRTKELENKFYTEMAEFRQRMAALEN